MYIAYNNDNPRTIWGYGVTLDQTCDRAWNCIFFVETNNIMFDNTKFDRLTYATASDSMIEWIKKNGNKVPEWKFNEYGTAEFIKEIK